MAQIVFGMAAPHSGMQGQPPEEWPANGKRDRANPELWYRNRTWTYPELEAERRGEGIEALLTLDELAARSRRCLAAIAEMRAAYEAANVDVAVILGKDQKEIFIDHTPSFAVYSGAEIYNGPPQRAVFAPDHAVTYPAHPELALHLIHALEADGFDLTDLIAWPPNTWQKNEPIVPHAYGFIYRQIMGDRPPPNVPILINTFYPPTQPSMLRAIAFGRSLLDAIKAWDSDKRVALIASGGLSHFVCDETLDAKLVGALGSYDFETLAGIDDRTYQSGTSEVKLYTAVLVAMQDAGAKMTLVDYVPCYRTPAGTGEGMGYMYWRNGQ
jgi:hypothetical protein